VAQLQKLNISIILILISTVAYAGAGYLSNGFFITDRSSEFEKITKAGKCKGTIKYPNIHREDAIGIETINDAIKDFVESYNFCSLEDPKVTKYEVKEGSSDYFSIKWITTNSKNKSVMINTLNFAKGDGKLLTVEDILNSLAKNFMPELVKLSENHLATDTSWEQFLDKIEQRYIQFYIINSKWHIIFNPHRGINTLVVDKELPNYLLKSQ